MLVKFEQNKIVCQNYTKFWAFWPKKTKKKNKKTGCLKLWWASTPLEDISVAETIVDAKSNLLLMLKHKRW